MKKLLIVIGLLTTAGCTYHNKTDITCVAVVLDDNEENPRFGIEDCAAVEKEGE